MHKRTTKAKALCRREDILEKVHFRKGLVWKNVFRWVYRDGSQKAEIRRTVSSRVRSETLRCFEHSPTFLKMTRLLLRPQNGSRNVHSKRGSKRFRVGASSIDRLSVFSPSKINLFLRILRRRSDGFHDLASLFHVIDLGDQMAFAPIEDKKDRLTCNFDDIPTDENNLVIKALNLFRNKTGSKQCFEIDLQKNVPHGAGLGGGSANAATTLWAANKLNGNVKNRFCSVL